MVMFDKVEVVNRLHEAFVYETVKNYTESYDKTWIFDKIHHEINQVRACVGVLAGVEEFGDECVLRSSAPSTRCERCTLTCSTDWMRICSWCVCGVCCTALLWLHHVRLWLGCCTPLQALQSSCNTWAPGIEIIAVRVTKPRIVRPPYRATGSLLS